MKRQVLAYYRVLSDSYDEKIRQLVPRYDEMTSVVISRVVDRSPRAVLDIGCGTGALAERVLDRLPDTTVIALDASPEMIGHARERLARFSRRARVIEGDVAIQQLDHRVDVAFSSLVLHNLRLRSKQRVLRAVSRALTPMGAFIWADLIRRADPASQADAVEYRRQFALRAGCDPDLVDVNFRKEANDDSPLTVEGMVHAAAEAGLGSSRTLWSHDTFAVLELERETA